jgi:hypothetical protein
LLIGRRCREGGAAISAAFFVCANAISRWIGLHPPRLFAILRFIFLDMQSLD